MLKNKNYRVLFIVHAMVFLFISCENKKLNYREVQISTAPHIRSDILNVKDFTIDIKPDPSSRYSLSIVIYSFSQGKETISMKGEGEFVTEAGAAEIKALVKIMDGEKFVKAEFVEVSGSSNDELVRNLAKSVSALKGY